MSRNKFTSIVAVLALSMWGCNATEAQSGSSTGQASRGTKQPDRDTPSGGTCESVNVSRYFTRAMLDPNGYDRYLQQHPPSVAEISCVKKQAQTGMRAHVDMGDRRREAYFQHLTDCDRLTTYSARTECSRDWGRSISSAYVVKGQWELLTPSVLADIHSAVAGTESFEGSDAQASFIAFRQRFLDMVDEMRKIPDIEKHLKAAKLAAGDEVDERELAVFDAMIDQGGDAAWKLMSAALEDDGRFVCPCE